MNVTTEQWLFVFFGVFVAVVIRALMQPPSIGRYGESARRARKWVMPVVLLVVVGVTAYAAYLYMRSRP